MKRLIEKILFFDKTILILTTAAISAAIITVMSFIYTGNIEKENKGLKARLSQIQKLSGEVIRIKSVVESKEKKTGVKRSAGVVSTLEKILKGLGLEAQTIKPLGKTKINGFSEDNAELEIHSADLNSIVNLLYKVDISPLPMKINSFAMKSTFEDPDKFLFRMTVSLMSKK